MEVGADQTKRRSGVGDIVSRSMVGDSEEIDEYESRSKTRFGDAIRSDCTYAFVAPVR